MSLTKRRCQDMSNNSEGSKQTKRDGQPGIDPDIINAFNGSRDRILEGDRFEMLSAYLDGEVTVSERQQVQQWLDTDPQVQRLYVQLLKLHQGIENIPIPMAETSAQRLSEQVFQSIDRQQWFKQISFWGGAAIAAVVVAMASTFWPDSYSPTHKMVKAPPIQHADSEPLMIALNRPVVKIPLTATPYPGQSSKSVKK
jgi:hypothetical protein